MAGVYISQSERVLTNNSLITINKDDTLYCHTDKPDCCDNLQSVWISDDDDVDLQEVSTIENSDGMVAIMFDEITFSMFCCQIPDVYNNIMTVCINSG